MVPLRKYRRDNTYLRKAHKSAVADNKVLYCSFFIIHKAKDAYVFILWFINPDAADGISLSIEGATEKMTIISDGRKVILRVLVVDDVGT